MAESQSLVYLKCIKIGSKLRVRITSPGYKNDANAQFPRAIRAVDRKFSVHPEDIRLIRRGSSYFYSIGTRNLVTLDDGIPIPSQEIKNMIKKVFNTEDPESDCLVCMCEAKDSVFNPCGHFVCCVGCSNKLDKCPMCRTLVLSIINYDELK